MSNQSQPYTDTFILDCNRNNSVEADAGNNSQPAQFTNKQGNGLKLNRGDKVSLHSAFINEIGNTDGTIEFKGETIKNSVGETITYTLEETTNDTKQPMPIDNLYSANNEFPWNPDAAPTPDKDAFIRATLVGSSKKQLLQPYGAHQSDCQNVPRTFEMKDNEMNVQVAYYKTTNGENYLHLPRRFDMGEPRRYGNQVNPDKEGNGRVEGSAQLSTGFDPDEDTMPWAYHGVQWSGTPAREFSALEQIGYHDSSYNGLCNADVRVQSQVSADWFFQDKSRNIKCENLAVGDDGQTPAIGIDNRVLNTLGTTQRFRYKNDNSKYMIFKKERTYFTTPRPSAITDEFLTPEQLAECIKPANLAGSTTNDFLCYVENANDDGHPVRTPDANKTIRYYNVRDPACTSDWAPYYEIKNISVESGFKAPEDVAEEVSRSLNKTDEQQEIFSRVGLKINDPGYGGFGADVARDGQGNVIPPKQQVIHQCVGFKKDGTLFKSFYSTNHRHFGTLGAKTYFIESQSGVANQYPEKLPDAVRYMSAYHYIGVKRPNLWTTGRAFCRDALGVKAEVGKTWGEVSDFTFHPDAPSIGELQGLTAQIITTIPWSKRALLMKWIKSQGEYPELFDYSYSNIKVKGSYKDNDNVKFDKFQMGDSSTGKTLARFIHCDMAKSNANHWKDKDGKYKHDSARLGCDNYIYTKNTDYDADIVGAETFTGYEIEQQVVAGRVPESMEATPTTSHYPDSRAKRSGCLPYYDLSSVPLWFWFDQDRQDIDGGGQDMSCDDFNLCFGCMKKYDPAKEGVDNPTKPGEYIAFTTTRIGGMPDFFFSGCNQSNNQADQTYDHYNFLGVDRHFNAYGTDVIMPYAGYLTGTQPDLEETYKTAVQHNYYNDNTQFYYTNPPGVQQYPQNWLPDKFDANKLLTQNCNLRSSYIHALHTYIGANQITLNYDDEGSKRFNWLGLHTPEYIGNNFNAGSNNLDPTDETASNQVYKINKRLRGNTWTPEMMPYNTDVATTTKDTSGTLIEIATSNWNITQWDAIFDAQSGVVFTGFGGTLENKRHWSKSLWGLLGFSYDQLNYKYDNEPDNVKDRISFNTRINPDNQGASPYIMTNALVKTSDVSVYRENIYGAGMFNNQGISYGNVWHGGLIAQGGTTHTPPRIQDKSYHLNNPAISIVSTSVPIYADAQPTKMLKPYYLIRSNIIGDMKYIGGGNSTDGGQTLPIIGVVNKENGFGDYYFQTSQLGTFTITDDVVISEIKTSIHDPDMSLARVDKNSAVLYLIEKQNTNNLNVLSTLMQSGQIIPQMLEPPPGLTDEQYQQYFSQGIINSAKQQEASNEANVAQHYQTTGGEPDEDQGTSDFTAFTFGGFAEEPEAPTEPRRQPDPTAIGSRIRARVQQENIQGRARYAGAPNPENPRRLITRAGTRKLEQYRGFQERARARLYQNFVRAGDAPAHQASDIPPWYREAERIQPGLGRTISQAQSTGSEARSEQSAPSSVPITAPSEPNATPRPAQKEPEPQPQP